MTLITTYIDQGICNGTYQTVQEMAGLTSGGNIGYILIYAFFVLLMVILFTTSRSIIIGAMAGIVGFVIINIIGTTSGCVPMPDSVGLILQILLFVFALVGLLAIKYAKSGG